MSSIASPRDPPGQGLASESAPLGRGAHLSARDHAMTRAASSPPRPAPALGWQLARVCLTGFAVAMALGGPLLAVGLSAAPADEVYAAVVALTLNAFVVGYIPALMRYVQSWQPVDLAPLLAHSIDGTLPPTAPSGAWVVPAKRGAAAAGLVFGVLSGYVAGGAYYRLLAAGSVPEATFVWISAWQLPVIPLLWAIAFRAFVSLGHRSRVLFCFARDGLRVDLHDTRALDALATVGVRTLLVVMGGLAIMPLQGALLGDLPLVEFAPALLVVIPVALLAAGAPVLGARAAIRCEKLRTLAAIDAALPPSYAALSEKDRALALYRQMIAATSEWPVSLSNRVRVGVYVVIPPLAWAAAAVVESFVSRALGL